MAEAFETIDVILTAQQVQHINERHVDLTQHARTSKSFVTFNPSATLSLLSRRTWETRDGVQLINHGWTSFFVTLPGTGNPVPQSNICSINSIDSEI